MPSNPKISRGRRTWSCPIQANHPLPNAACPSPEKQEFPKYLLRSEASPGQGHLRRGQGLSQPWGWMFSGRGGRSACAPISHPFCACAARCERLKEILIALLGENEPVNAAICCAKDSRPERFLLAAMIIWSRENELALPPQSDLHGGEVSEQQQSDYLGVRPCPSLEEMWV